MSNLFYFLIFLLCSILFMLKDPMQLLILVMTFMLMIIAGIFLSSLDYWTTFVMLLSFLVGLFLMFVYMVSFSKKDNSTLNKSYLSQSSSIMQIFLLSLFVSTSVYYLKIFLSPNLPCSMSWYEKWSQEKSEIMLIFMASFFFLVLLMFYMMKKTKKNMKSSV